MPRHFLFWLTFVGCLCSSLRFASRGELEWTCAFLVFAVILLGTIRILEALAVLQIQRSGDEPLEADDKHYASHT